MTKFKVSSHLPIRIFNFIAAFAVCCAAALNGTTAVASDSLVNVVRSQAIELTCAAEDMRDEIKTHFRGTRCYGKLLAINARIKSRSAAIERRIDRNPCYRGMERDIAKLNELACELSEAYEVAMTKSNAGIGRPVTGSTCHVVDKLVGIISLADSVRAASVGLNAFAGASPEPGLSQIIHVSEFNPNIDVAPGVPPGSDENRLRPNQDRSASLKVTTPTLEGPKPVFRSVLEK